MTKHEEIFKDIPVGSTLCRHWAKQNTAVLNSAATKLAAHGANPWVFGMDARGFWQFADSADRAALASLTSEEQLALMGPWGPEDYDPESFGIFS